MERTDSTNPTVAKTEQGEIPPDLLDELREIIAAGKWRYARAAYMPSFWYRMPLLENSVGHIEVGQMLTLVDAITAHGYDGHFGRRPVRYLDVGAWRYFAVGVDRDDPIAGTINRTKRPGLDHAAVRGDDPVDDRGIRIRSSSEAEQPSTRRESPPEDDPEARQRYRDALSRFLENQDESLRGMVEREDFSLRVIRRFQLDIPDRTLTEIRATIATGTWNFASTMPWIPHFYVVRGKTLPYGQFVRFAILLRHFGHDENYGSRIHRYLDLDGYKYWTMGEPIAETEVINRARLAPQAAFGSTDVAESRS